MNTVKQIQTKVFGLKSLSVLVSAMLYAGTVFANATLDINLPTQSLDQSLHTLAKQTGAQILFTNSIASTKKAKSIKGQLTVEQALQQLLQGTGLEVKENGNNSFSIVPITKKLESSQNIKSSENITELSTIIVTATKDAATEAQNEYTVSQSSSATKLDLAIKETPQSITTFTAKQIQDQGLLTLNEVLDQTPGVTLVTAGVAGAGSQPIYARTFPVTSVQMDGVMANTYILSGSSTGDIGIQDSFLYDRIDILRGSNSLTGGAGDASASLNFVRKHPLPSQQLQANLKYGSWNTKRAEVDFSTLVTDRLSVRLAGAYQEGDHWVDNVSSERTALSLIGAFDINDYNRVSLGVTHYDFQLNGASPHGITRFSEVNNYAKGTGLHAIETDPINRNFNNATPWSRTNREYTNLFATWDHTFANDWQLKTSYNYASNKDDKMYGEIGTAFYVPSEDRASYAARRDNHENSVNAFDINLKGSFDFRDREQEFVIGANYYDVHRKVHWGYASTPVTSSILNIGAGPQHQRLCSAEAFQQINTSWDSVIDTIDVLIAWWYEDQAAGWDPGVFPSKENFNAERQKQLQERTATCEQRSGISIQEWVNNNGKAPEEWTTDVHGYEANMFDSQITTHTKSRQTGVYFATHLRPLERTHLILGGRWAKDTWDSPYYSCNPEHAEYNKYCTGQYVGRAATPQKMDPKFLPYAGLIYEITPEINGYVSYTSTYVRDINSSNTINWATGQWLPPVRSITYEGGLKGGFFDDRLNVAASYFKMEQKDFPYQTNNASTSGTIDNGWRVYGWELNVAGAITPNWKIAGGYVRQKQVVPFNDGEVLSAARDDFTGSYRAPNESLKLFTSYNVLDNLTVGAGLRWQSDTQSAWIPLTKNQVEQQMMKQDPFHIVDLMARYQINERLGLQLNANNIFDKTYYQHERSYISGAPRNYLMTLSYKY